MTTRGDDDYREVAAVEITYVLLTSVLALLLVICVEWLAWHLFSLTSAAWRPIGVAVLLVAVAGLIVRAVHLLRRQG